MSALAWSGPVLADMHGNPETPMQAQERRNEAEGKQKLADVSTQYRRLQENSERTVLIVRAEGAGPESITQLIQSVDSIMYWFNKKRGGQREWFVNFEWGNMAVGAQFLLQKKDAPPPFPPTADALFSRFTFTYATEQALEGFVQWCRAGGQARAVRPCAEALEHVAKRTPKS